MERYCAFYFEQSQERTMLCRAVLWWLQLFCVMSEALKGRIPTIGTKGIKFSEEARLHMSISAKEAWKRRKVQNIRMQSTKHFN